MCVGFSPPQPLPFVLSSGGMLRFHMVAICVFVSTECILGFCMSWYKDSKCTLSVYLINFPVLGKGEMANVKDQKWNAKIRMVCTVHTEMIY